MPEPKVGDLKIESEGSSMDPQVLIVEDEPAVEETVRVALEEENAQIVGSYKSGGETIKMLQERNPSDPPIHILFTDIGLSDGATGPSVVDAFKGKYPKSSVVILTARGKEETDKLYSPERQKELNITILHKPIGMSALADKVIEVRDSINKPST